MGNKISQLLFVLGIILLIISFIEGESKAGVFLIFPFIYGSGILSFAGIILIFLSIAMFLFSIPEKFDDEIKILGEDLQTDKKAGGVILLGPIPIFFSNDWSVIKILGIIALVFILIIIIFLLILTNF